MIVDAWMQHPTLRFIEHDMFASLRRWTGGSMPAEEIPIDATVGAMDAAGVQLGSAYTARRYPPELVRYIGTRGGREKVLFGTNWPMIPPQQALEDLDALGLDDEARERFLGGNARRVFGL